MHLCSRSISPSDFHIIKFGLISIPLHNLYTYQAVRWCCCCCFTDKSGSKRGNSYYDKDSKKCHFSSCPYSKIHTHTHTRAHDHTHTRAQPNLNLFFSKQSLFTLELIMFSSSTVAMVIC
jgi:hypothetical protein